MIDLGADDSFLSNYVKKGTTTCKRHKRLGSTEAEQIPSSKRKCLRQAIFYHFIHVLDALCNKHWKGHGGTIFLIRKALHLDFDHHHKIIFTLKEMTRCIRVGGSFDGTIKSHAGQKQLTKPGSTEETLVVA